MANTYYFGLGVTYHDPALAIVGPAGEVRYAEATERPLQSKRAINCEPDRLDLIPKLLHEHCPDMQACVLAFNWRSHRPWYEQTMAGLGLLSPRGLLRNGFKRLRSPLENYQLHHMMACNRRSIARGGLNLVRVLRESHPACFVGFQHFDHHTAHGAMACRASGFREAACAVIDSYGEHGSMAFFAWRDGRLQRLEEARGLGSLGLYFMKLTELCGFDWTRGEEWKLMGLAAYGHRDPEAYRLLDSVIRAEGLRLRHPRRGVFEALARLEEIGRDPGRTADLAHTGQCLFAELMSRLLSALHGICPSDRLVLAGGCALNSSFNGQIVGRTPFKEVYVPSAPADDGSALGAAWLAFEAARGKPENVPEPAMLSPFLGSEICPNALERLRRNSGGLIHRRLGDNIAEETAGLIAEGKLVAWMQGRAEFGPRSLGNRSILADPRDPAVKDRINERVKFREPYRPFAPSILPAHGAEYFEHFQSSPYMDKALKFRPAVAGRVPGVVHVDGTGRLQTVNEAWNPRFHRLIQGFHRRTGVPLLLNTSFNVMGKPIVHSVEDAVSVFLTSGLDALVIGDDLFLKPEAP